MKLQVKASEYHHFLIIVIEYMTTKCCHHCGKSDTLIKGASFQCNKCGYHSDRGNASCNIRDLAKLKLAKYLEKMM